MRNDPPVNPADQERVAVLKAAIKAHATMAIDAGMEPMHAAVAAAEASASLIMPVVGGRRETIAWFKRLLKNWQGR